MKLLLLTLLAAAQSDRPVVYQVSLDNADHHELEVTATFPSLPAGPLHVRMSRSSPGRYALHEFAKNVYDVHFTDGSGREVDAERTDPHGWRVDGHDGTAVMRYRVFGDRVDGTYLAVDSTHAHMNMPATFAWAKGLEGRPIELRVERARDGFRVATQLEPTSDPNVFRAPDLYYFLDSPTEVSAHELHEWEVDGQTIRLALHHELGESVGAAYAQLAEAVVREQARIFGELPRFDYGTYTFIADYLPYASGDGMEHRNSTILSTTRSLEQASLNLSTVSHEFFHAWNVERIRPRALEPFDFERANMSDALWFAEGFTSYYGTLTLKRAGVTSLERYARSASQVLNAVMTSPGRAFDSPMGMSRRAPFVDAAVSVDPTNEANTFISYYSYGAALALALDLSIRDRYPGKTLDDFMRAVWRTHGRTEVPYAVDDLESLLAEVVDRDFASDFFDRYVRESELPDYEALLARAGLRLRRAREGKAVLRAQLRDEGDRVVVETSLRGGAAYAAGLDRGDVIVSLGGESVTSTGALAGRLELLAPGDSVEIVFDKRGEERRSTVVLGEDPRLEVVSFESLGEAPTSAMLAFRDAWLSSSDDPGLRRYCHVCGRHFDFELEYCPYDGKALQLRPKS